MAAFTLSADTNIDALTSKTGGDTYDTNGWILTIDQDSRYGTNQTTSTSLGSITINATKGGNVEIDSRYIRLIPYDTGTGTVPAYNTVISQGSASGKLIGVISALNATPTAVGAAMPVSGYIKVKQWNSVAYAAGALTGIGASATGADIVGFLELVGDEASTINANRLGIFRMRGEWFDLGTTSGSNATTYQAPTNGSVQYYPMIEVETGTGTGVYEIYVNAGGRTALLANIGTDSNRGKVFWSSTAGVIRFQHDGTNSTGGYLPPSGRKIRMPNILTANCTTAARTTNALPNATLATRYDFTCTGGGQIIMDKVLMNWYPSFSQAFSVQLDHVGIATQILIAEIAQALTWTYVGVGQIASETQTSLSMSLCFAGGTMSNCVWSAFSLAASGRYVVSISDISGFTFNNEKIINYTKNGNATSGASTITRASNCTWSTPINIGGGRYFLTTCSNVAFNNTQYTDVCAVTTPTSIPMYLFDIGTNCVDVTFDGVTFPVVLNQPYSGILQIGAAGCARIKLRNLGTSSTPLEMGGDRQSGVSWTRSTTTATVTFTAHGLKINDIIYVIVSSDTSAIVVGSKTVASVPTANTFTFTCLNAGSASGTLSYYPTMSANVFVLASGAAANTVKVQRCYTQHTRTNMFTSDNSSKNVLVENSWGDLPLAGVAAALNTQLKGLGNTFAMTAQTSVYGTHWFDCFTTGAPANLAGVSWTRTTTTATVTSTDHRLKTGDFIEVNTSSSVAAIVLGKKTITVTTKDAFTFTCLNAGSASGTLTMSPFNGRIGLVMNESSADTSSQYTIDSGTPAFTSAGGLYMPTIGQQVTFISPEYIIGHTGFPIDVPVMAGGGSIGNFDITYAIDKNDGNGYGSFHNNYYPRAGGGGANASTNITMTSTTGVEVGDYITGTNVGIRAKVQSITDSTTIVSTVANIGTVSGVLVFNQLPNEVVDSSLGFKIKTRIKTSTANTTAITSLYAWTTNTTTSRGYQYPLDPVTVTYTILDAADSLPVVGARVYIIADVGGPAVSGTVIANQVTDGSGQISFIYAYVGSQPITGRVRKSTSSPLYKTSPLSGIIATSGYSGTIFMVKDE